jgi:hypothetical protein
MDKRVLEQISRIVKSTVNERIDDLRTGINEGIAHKMSPETKREFEEVKETLVRMEKGNNEQHKELISHQKHTNGSVSKLQIWRGTVAGGLAVITLFLGAVTTFYFLERNNQQAKFEEVIKMRVELTALKDELNRLDLND